jgi:hypothetical protein
VEESVEHLFVECPFAKMCWDIISIDIPLGSSFPEHTAQLKIQLNSQFFMEAISLMCWTIWIARNDLILSVSLICLDADVFSSENSCFFSIE